MVPITRRASSPNKKMLYFLINNKPILIRSMLAAGIVQERLLEKLDKAKEAKSILLQATSTAGTFTAPARKPSVS